MSGPPHEKMTVAINALTELAPRYGSRVYLFGLARALAQIPQINVVLVVGCGQTIQLPSDLQELGVEIPVPIGRSYWQFVFASRIHKALKKAGASIWHLPNSLPIISKPATTLITIHDVADLRVRKYGRTRTQYRRSMNYLAAHRADHILTVSQNSKRDLLELFGIPDSKITVVYPGVDEAFRPLDPVTCRDYLSARYNVPRDFILAPGGLARNKNVGGLLRAYAELGQQGIRHALVCTGSAEPKELRQIEKTIEELNLAGKVLLTGHVPEADLPKFYNASSVVAYLSTYEGFGLPIIEAMACGAPIVASNTASIPEVAGASALLVDPDDPKAIAAALRRVLGDAQLRTSLIASGLERARQFSWRQTAIETLAVYVDVLAKNPVASHKHGCVTVAE